MCWFRPAWCGQTCAVASPYALFVARPGETRLGVAAALVGGCWVGGDAVVERGRLVKWGLTPAVGSKVVAPGFVDLQVNGFAGVDYRTASPADHWRAAEAMARTGVVAHTPTLYSSTVDGYLRALRSVKTAMAEVTGRGADEDTVGKRASRILGAHLEGPFLSPEWPGAHDPTRFTPPDPELLEEWLTAGPVHTVTIAPELAGSPPLIRLLAARGVTVSLGHTDATAEQCRAAADDGASMVTHVFNAHRRFAGRDPGPAGAALADDRFVVGLIADGFHVADDAIRLVFAAAGDRVALVTDAVAPAATNDSEWTSGGVTVIVEGGRAALPDGTLAGSVSTMDQCVRHCISLGINPAHVLMAAAGGPRFAGHSWGVVVLDDGWNVVGCHPVPA